ncbi:MAG: NADPH-dependent 7-cyano-7-deazaguanine reductase [Desulfonauticus sp. 38_4375]|nr:MAG: NADPH-dependent 7-cyano-7-deazaguanine reductase [Desulfonauticus sp. 38_4375]
MFDDVSGLKLLGKSKTEYPSKVSPDILETFPNRFPDRDYWVTMISDEFTSLCPMTGQPDYGTILIRYIPDKKCIESKSLKFYLFSYRQEPTFMETVVNRILDDLVKVCSPKEMQVIGKFKPRGGVIIEVEASYKK